MSDDPIYLDYASTTPVDPQVAELLHTLMGIAQVGNASSSHRAGRRSLARVDAAAEKLAAVMHGEARNLIWTSGATEANNLAIAGAAQFRANRGRHLLTMRTEHKAVSDVFTALEKQGFDVSWLDPGADGLLDPAVFENALRDDTQLVSIMHVNNETGVVQDVQGIAELCRSRDILFHVDAAQSLGKVPLDLRSMPIDLLSVTAHKLYGPPGIGALYIDERPGCHIEPRLFGGGQQRRLRPGTLPVALISAFAEAAGIAAARMLDDLGHYSALRERLLAGLRAVDGIVINGDPDHAFPGILNVSVPGVNGESLMLALEPLCVAQGSACNAQSSEPSAVLRALGRSDELAQSAIRFSFGRETTAGEIDRAIRQYTLAVTRLRQIAPGRAA